MIEEKKGGFTLKKGDALIIVDVQNDFLPAGNLGVSDGDKVVPVLNRYIEISRSKKLPLFATRDWHPPAHSSFREYGGPWPPHCVVDSEGAQFAANLNLPLDSMVISKGTAEDSDAYSGFEGTNLDEKLRSLGVARLLIGGLATDYCVLNTVKDAIKLGYDVLLLSDAIKAVDVSPGDGKRAIEEMKRDGAIPVRLDMVC